ncbi:MAG: DUF433 domain-containing protein, partial [Burkholderiales bacterium]
LPALGVRFDFLGWRQAGAFVIWPGGEQAAVPRERRDWVGWTHMKRPVIHSDPAVQGGLPVFVGTRVPVKNLFDYLEAGDSLEDFLRSFPSVKREQAVAALELARQALAMDAHPA